MTAYNKEIRSTIGFGLAYVFLGHMGLWSIVLGTDNDLRILGLPAHYVIAILAGSLGVFLLSLFWTRYANNLEDEIAAENTAALENEND